MYALAAKRFGLAVALLTLAACETFPSAPPAEEPPEPGVLAATKNGPSGAPEGTCWGKTVSPAVIETVTKQVEVKPAVINPDGTVGALPVYRDESKQQIVVARRDNWFETPCPEALTPEFIATLQRALHARGSFAGEITSQLDTPTLNAIQAFQNANGGPDSSVLTLETARTLGLVAIPRTPSE